MRIRDLANVIDMDMPIWVNQGGYSDRYENYRELIIESDTLGDDEIKYITVDGTGEFTIEI